MPGSRWRGYVVEMGDAIVRMSSFTPNTRARRASRRARALAALGDGMSLSGRVLATGSGGALVAFGDGLLTGLVPAPALRSRIGRALQPDRELSFRVVGRPTDPEDREVDLYLWPLPEAARSRLARLAAEGTPPAPAKSGAVTRSSTTTALTLSEEIRQRFDEFSRSQKDVGQYIVDHLEEAAFHTAEELARRANTSSSTVVRFAQALGFEGFPELQAAARDEYRRAREQATGTPDLANPPLFPIDQTEFETALAADHANLAETARKIDRDEVSAAVDLISRADRIVLCGTDQMAFFASYLRHLLMLLDLRAEVVASPSQEGLAKLGRVDDKTVLVGFSAGRPHPLVVRAMKLARNRRAATIAVADATLSEVAKLADHRLYYSSNSPAYVRSHTALLGLVQALAYGVYALDESAYADRIKAFRLK